MAVVAARPQVSVLNVEKDAFTRASHVALPHVFLAPIRQDVVHFVHSNMAKNRRQPYAVSLKAGMQHSAESWGTGRAVARIPRVSGGGTHRAGQAAFGNMCRKGRMFAPTKIWRKWHKKINLNQKRFAVASALAASALAPLVQARGHKIDHVPEVPLVVSDAVQSLTKTKEALATLTALKAHTDVEKVKESRKVRPGQGKLRNRRHVQRRGPLVVFSDDKGLVKAFRNLPGVELAHVDRLNLLQLAPGGHLGRFIIWTKSAFERLDSLYGHGGAASELKKNYHLPRAPVAMADIGRVINSDEVQSVLKPKQHKTHRPAPHKNPLTNLGAKIKLNPFAVQLRRADVLAQQRSAKRKLAAADAKAKGQKLPLAPHAAKLVKAAKSHQKQQLKNYRSLVNEAGYDWKNKKQIDN